MRPDLRAEFGRRARQAAYDNFSIDKALQRYERLYFRLLSAKGWKPKPSKVSAVEEAL